MRAPAARRRPFSSAKGACLLRDATARFHAALPGSDVIELPGQVHVAMDAAPELFEREVRTFFGPSSENA
jgi:pimeloyl-ACP methyl ester carboxylesterase